MALAYAMLESTLRKSLLRNMVHLMNSLKQVLKNLKKSMVLGIKPLNPLVLFSPPRRTMNSFVNRCIAIHGHAVVVGVVVVTVVVAVVEDAIQSRILPGDLLDLRDDVLSPGKCGVGIHQAAVVPGCVPRAATASGDVGRIVLRRRRFARRR